MTQTLTTKTSRAARIVKAATFAMVFSATIAGSSIVTASQADAGWFFSWS